MRVMVLVAIALAGCGEGTTFDDTFKKEFRAQFVNRCSATAGAAVPAAKAVTDRVCACTADKVMRGASAADLVNPSTERLAQAAQECAAEIGPVRIAPAS